MGGSKMVAALRTSPLYLFFIFLTVLPLRTVAYGHNVENKHRYHYPAIQEVVVDAVEIPNPIQVGHSAKLRCVWRVGSRGFYSTRWYKNNTQFYSYIKGTLGNSNNKVEGVNVVMASSDDHVVALDDVSPQTEGEYKCEIMSEGPQFKINHASANLTVVELPEVPEFLGLRDRYQVGDLLNVTCRAQNGRPAPTLEIRVNDITIHEKSGSVRQLAVTKGTKPGLVTSQSRLVLPLQAGHQSTLKLGCFSVTHGLVVQKEINVPVDHRSSFFSLFGSSSGVTAGWSKFLALVILGARMVIC